MSERAADILEAWCRVRGDVRWFSGPSVEVSQYGTAHTLNVVETRSFLRPPRRWRIRVDVPAEDGGAVDPHWRLADAARRLIRTVEFDLAANQLGNPDMAAHKLPLTLDQKAQRRALLAAVCQSPEDDAPRLIFSDWLEENGNDLWASLIRAQVAMANEDVRHCRGRTANLFLCEGSDWRKRTDRRCGWCALLAEEARVFDHWHAAGGGHPDPFRLHPYLVHWGRGFIDSVSGVSPDTWFHFGPRLVRVHPVKVVMIGVAVRMRRGEIPGTVLIDDERLRRFRVCGVPFTTTPGYPLKVAYYPTEEIAVSQMLIQWAAKQPCPEED